MNAAADYSVSEAERLAGKPLAGLPLSELTIADRLRSAGYATGVIGKWHLGEEEAFHPSKRGFDEFYGFLGGGSRYLPAKRTPVLERGGVREVCKEYLTDAFSDEAVAFIDRHSEEPFFLYLSYNCPHTPMEAKPEDLARFKSIADPTRRALAGMMYAMDRGVGRVMDKLESAGLEEDTLVLFISDNGGQTTKNASLNTPFAGKKGDLLEGGIRVPFFARWTGRIPADLVLDDAVTSLDVCSTAVSLAGLPVAPELDGLDLSRYLCGQVDALPARVLCWRFGEQRAIRRGDWKYYSYMDDISLLFDLSTDPGERRNLIGAHPGIAEELQGLHSQWELGMVEPLWDTPMNHSLRLRALGRRYGINAASPK